jgi:molybdopterin converting factor small subunit
LFSKLAESNADFQEIVYDPVEDRLREQFFILVNGKLSASYAGLETKVREGDEIVLVPPVIGG